jgi:hypothetical protein
MRNTFNAWLAAWGEERGFGAITLDDEGFAALEDDAGLIISLFLPADKTTLQALVDVGPTPEFESPADASEFYELLLINNFGASREKEGVLTREVESGHILLAFDWSLEDRTHSEELDTFLQQVSLLGNIWRDRLDAATTTAADIENDPLDGAWDEATEETSAHPAPIPSTFLKI